MKNAFFKKLIALSLFATTIISTHITPIAAATTYDKGVDIVINNIDTGYNTGDVFMHGSTAYGWECYGFSEFLAMKTWGVCYNINPAYFTNKVINRSVTADELKALLNGASPAAHIRTIAGKYSKDSGWYAHSYTLVSSCDDSVVIAEANYDWNNGVRVRKLGYAELAQEINSYSGLYRVVSYNKPHVCTSFVNTPTTLGACKTCGKKYDYQSTFSKENSGFYGKKWYNFDALNIYNEPYEDASKVAKAPSKITVLGSVTNAYSNQWFKVSYEVENYCLIGYVYGKNLHDAYSKRSDLQTATPLITNGFATKCGSSSAKVSWSIQGEIAAFKVSYLSKDGNSWIDDYDYDYTSCAREFISTNLVRNMTFRIIGLGKNGKTITEPYYIYYTH